MNEKDFVNLCKKAVAEYSNEHLDKSDGKKITEDDVFIVWMCKTLQNSKALASTTLLTVCTTNLPSTGTRKNSISTPTKSGKIRPFLLAE